MSGESHVEDLLPGYALGSLEDDELVVVARHLALCPSCRQELLHYARVVEQLAEALPPAAPPHALWGRIEEEIGVAVEAEASTGPLPVRTKAGSREVFRFLRRPIPTWIGAGAAFVVLALLAVLLLGRGPANLSNSRNELSTIALVAAPAAKGATGLVVAESDGDHGTLVVDGLAPLGKAQCYELWLVKRGTRVSGATFSVTEDGYATVSIEAPEPLATYTAFGITIEPGSGSPAPTGMRVLQSARAGP